MKKFLVSSLLGLVLSAVPMSIFALPPSCPSILRFEYQGQVQLCGLSGSYTSNGVLVCEYSC
jgi:hypothetical protein